MVANNNPLQSFSGGVTSSSIFIVHASERRQYYAFIQLDFYRNIDRGALNSVTIGGVPTSLFFWTGMDFWWFFCWIHQERLIDHS